MSFLTSPFYDTYSRSVTGGWGTSDSGYVWSVAEGLAANFSVNGEVGRLNLTATNQVAVATITADPEADVDITSTVSLSSMPTGDAVTFGVVGRRTSSTVYLGGRAILNPDGSVTVAAIQSGVTLASATLGTIFSSFASGVSVRMRVVGGVFRVKVWDATGSEPANWNLTTTATLLTAGSVGIRMTSGVITNALPLAMSVDGVIVNAAALGDSVSDTFTRTAERINNVKNPSFEVNTVNWAGVSGTVARSTAQAHTGTASLLVTATTAGATDRAAYTGASVTAGLTYTASGQVRMSTATPRSMRMVFVFRNAANALVGTASGTTVTPTTTGWTAISTSGVAPATAVTVQIFLTGQDAATVIGDAWFFDSFLLEQSTTVGTYFDGSLSSANWTGTAHDSNSVLGGLGTSNSDHTYTISGNAEDYTLSGTQAVFATYSDGVDRTAVVNFFAAGDIRMSAKVKTSLDPTDRDVGAGLFGRYTNSSNYVVAWVKFGFNSQATGYISEVVGGVRTDLVGPVALGAYVVADQFNILFEVLGNQYRAKFWKEGSVTPGSWTATSLVGSLPVVSGSSGMKTIRTSGGTAETVSISFDDLAIRDIAPTITAIFNGLLDSPGVRITVNNGDVHNKIRVARVPLDNRLPTETVRGLDLIKPSGPVATATDYEVPLDEQVVYRLDALNSDLTVVATATSDPVEIEVPYHRVVLGSVGQPTLSRRIQITSLPSFSKELRVLQEARVLHRPNPVVLFDVMEGMTGTFQFMTVNDHDPDGRALRTLVDEGQPLYFRNVSRITGIDDFYCVITNIEAERKGVLNPNVNPRYVYTAQFKQVSRPPTDAEVLGIFTWQTLLDAGFDSWTQVDNSYTSWLSVLNFASRGPIV